ncbi:MAG: hypothetical protein U0990_02190 [Candidatus Nanopelagicales bacterium]|nr:hypothetical protein [Candidatus Nanopelagicales bacterium]MDZ4248880.1 hypothetical protein [Candidatus Nanopelagicales bacterium]
MGQRASRKAWAQHPKKYFREPLALAESRGWSLRQSSGHSWGTIKCPSGACSIVIFSTGKGGESVALGISRKIERCPHGGVDLPGGDPANGYLDGAQRLIEGAEALRRRGVTDEKIMEVLSEADDAVGEAAGSDRLKVAFRHGSGWQMPTAVDTLGITRAEPAMTTAITLQVTGIDLSDESVLAVIGEQLSDAMWAETDGIVTMTIFTDKDAPVAEATLAARRVRNRIPGAKAIRVYQDLVSVSDIAGRVGVSREATRKWAKIVTGAAFPTPVGAAGGGERGATRLWEWASVARWLERERGIDMDEDLPDAITVAEINARLAGIPDVAKGTIKRTVSSGPARTKQSRPAV